ncbi:hypothetical protein [Thermofilum sp.]|jgi:hypothetical protein|uniref:hypothetical protein n=1 Tax=Thermofilum sp. TaxID=1961369 RepID=UPI002588D899|nr:hypothetical protein [Thermofilum sp.]
MTEMDYEEVEEKEEERSFAYLLESDFGDIYLLQTDPSGRVVYNKWFLFNKDECSVRKLAYAISFIHKTVDPIDEEKIVLDAISACRPVMRKVRKMRVW